MPRRLGYAIAAAVLVALTLSFGGVAGAATPVPAGANYVVYCATSSATSFEGCYVDGATAQVTVPGNSKVTADPVVPPTATATSGLTAPDGILGVIPPGQVSRDLGIPGHATTILYIDKQVGHFIPGTLVSSLALPISTPTDIPVTGDYSGFGAGTYYVASNADVNTGPAGLNCTGATTTELTGCTSAATDSIAAGSDVGAPGSCTTPGSVLQTIGEGSTKGKTLFKNNEDYAAVRMATRPTGSRSTT